jgi:hypothetical protein
MNKSQKEYADLFSKRYNVSIVETKEGSFKLYNNDDDAYMLTLPDLDLVISNFLEQRMRIENSAPF